MQHGIDLVLSVFTSLFLAFYNLPKLTDLLINCLSEFDAVLLSKLGFVFEVLL